MNQMNFSMSELMSSLQSADGVIKPVGSILNVEKASSSTSMSKGKKGKKKNPGAKGSMVGPTPKICKSKGNGKGNYFQCGEPGH